MNNKQAITKCIATALVCQSCWVSCVYVHCQSKSVPPNVCLYLCQILTTFEKNFVGTQRKICS